MKNEKYISDRISFFDHGTSTSIVISSKINRLKETMLLFWILCWSACGIYLVYEFNWFHLDQDFGFIYANYLLDLIGVSLHVQVVMLK